MFVVPPEITVINPENLVVSESELSVAVIGNGFVDAGKDLRCFFYSQDTA